jgi:hypothetical protein
MDKGDATLLKYAFDSLTKQSVILIILQRFFLNHRTSILSLTLENDPALKDLGDWERKKSTKLDAFVRICKHYLSRDDAPHVSFKDGKLIVPESPRVADGQAITQKRRICAFLEFTQFKPLIRRVSSKRDFIAGSYVFFQVLELHDIPFLWLDGQVPADKRTGIVQQLYKDGNPRLLIFSRVGGTGVNMAIADIMIHIVSIPFYGPSLATKLSDHAGCMLVGPRYASD